MDLMSNNELKLPKKTAEWIFAAAKCIKNAIDALVRQQFKKHAAWLSQA